MAGCRYRKKPVVIDAIRWGGANMFEVVAFCAETGYDCGPSADTGIRPQPVALVIRTLEGDMRADKGDYVIRGVKGECYPCKPDIFEATYEPADGAA